MVPRIAPGLVVNASLGSMRLALESVPDSEASGSSQCVTRAMPQSMTRTSPKPPSMTFAGFRSRWITPRECA